MAEPITVTQLNTRVKDLFNSDPGLHDIWVSGEISNMKKYSSGHYYFTLKDQGSEIRGVLFAGSRARMDFEPADNMKILAFGRVDMYVQRGSYQFIVETMRRSGLGDLFLAFAELKNKLQAEGLFESSRKKPLPAYPRTIGVVTSQTGAVIHDIITTSASRFPADILLAPAQVQGDGAARSIVAGIELLNRVGVDVIIIGRGGGSLEDLWAFNEEPVARAIAASKVPIVSAVGHETDFTISDMVADARAPTPTGAAAIILRDRMEILNQVQGYMARANRAMEGVVKDMRSRFDLMSARFSPARFSESIEMRSIHLDDLSSRMDNALKGILTDMRTRFDSVDSRLSPESALKDVETLMAKVDGSLLRIQDNAVHRMEASSDRLASIGSRPEASITRIIGTDLKWIESASKQLEGLNPLNVLGRGYAMVESDSGEVMTSVSGIDIGDNIRIKLRDGSVSAEVNGKEMKE